MSCKYTLIVHVFKASTASEIGKTLTSHPVSAGTTSFLKIPSTAAIGSKDMGELLFALFLNHNN